MSSLVNRTFQFKAPLSRTPISLGVSGAVLQNVYNILGCNNLVLDGIIPNEFTRPGIITTTRRRNIEESKYFMLSVTGDPLSSSCDLLEIQTARCWTRSISAKPKGRKFSEPLQEIQNYFRTISGCLWSTSTPILHPAVTTLAANM